jgi:peptidoglycan-associated lipoprotein
LGGDAALAGKVIYFDFDKSEIKPEFAGVISANAQALTSNPNLKVKLEGNTDERGTREYNIGLGERRAQAVRRALMLQGVSERQITTVSFGAERPAVEGDDESAWAKNRRVELVFQP